MKSKPSGIFASNPPSAMFGIFSMISVAVIAIIVAVVIPNILHKIQLGRQKTTMKTIKRIGSRMEQLKGAAGYPEFRSIEALTSMDKSLPVFDGWDKLLKFVSYPDVYYIVSAGKDFRFEQGDPKQYQPGLILHFNEDIVYSNGTFIRKPEEAKK